MSKYGSGPSKEDVANNVAGWDTVGFGSGSSSSGSSSSGSSSSRGSSGSSSGNSYSSSSNDSGGDSGGSRFSSSYDKSTGIDYGRNQNRANQVVRQGRYDVHYDDLGYVSKAVKVSDSPGYVVNGVTYDGNGNVVSGSGSHGQQVNQATPQRAPSNATNMSMYGAPVLNSAVKNYTRNGVTYQTGPSMARVWDPNIIKNGYYISNGYTVFVDQDGYATKAVKGVADYTPHQDINAANGSYNKNGAWTDNEILTSDDLEAIRKIRAGIGTMYTGDEANAAANAIRAKYGYSIDKKGYVTDYGALTAVNDQRQKMGLDTNAENGSAAYYRYLMNTDTSPAAQAAGQVKTYQQFAQENGYDVSAPTGVNGKVPTVQTTPLPGNSVIGSSGATGGGISGSSNLHMSPGTSDVYTPGNMGNYLNQWYQNAQQQQQNTVDFGTNQAILELLRNKQDAEAQYQEQRNQIAIDEAKAKDNQALYAESRGDKGGIGAAQYDAIMNTAAQNRLAVNSAQTKLATDTSRQIADLRAQGEYEKADALLTLSQQYLSQLMSLEQWAAEYDLSVAQFNASLQQWQAEYDLKVADLLGSYNGMPTMSAKEFAFTQQQYADKQQAEQEQKLASAGEILLAAGIMPSASQLAAMGMTETDAQSYITAQKVAAAAKGKSGSGSPGSGGGTMTSMDYDGLFKAARDSGNPQSFIANNYKKYGFTSPTGLYNDYKTAAETPVKSNMEMQPDHYSAFAQSIGAQLSAGQVNAALGNINSRWSELSATQKKGVQDILLKYGVQYNPGD